MRLNIYKSATLSYWLKTQKKKNWRFVKIKGEGVMKEELLLFSAAIKY